MSLIFYPLYWIYHDCWRYTETIQGEQGQAPIVRTYPHAGHCHLFMPDFDYEGERRQAYTGTQVYNFSLKDIWGPESGDPNQFAAYRLVGKPIWLFHVEEYWRRCYIQPWDKEDRVEGHINHPERIGIRYDASLPCHSLGPFRESRGLYFFNTEMNRTLPVEYWLNPERTKREHYLRKQRFGWDASESTQTWSFAPGARKWDPPQPWYYGNNAYYDDDGIPIGYNQPGDVVRHDLDEETIAYYRYAFQATAGADGYTWPNPTPGASEAVHRAEFLAYYNFDPLGLESRWEREYAERARAAGGDPDGAIFTAYVYEVFGEMAASAAAAKREAVDFAEFRGIWELLDDAAAKAAGVFGDYPVPREDAPAESPYGDPVDGDPFRDRDGNPLNPYDAYLQYFDRREEYTIPRGAYAAGDYAVERGGHPRAAAFSDEDGARRMYSDNLYYAPIIEYQTVTHLNYERLPGHGEPAGFNYWTDKTGAFGDGFEASVEIPFRRNGVIQSPFSDDAGRVYPAGEYFHDFDRANALKYAVEGFGAAISEARVAALEAAEAARQARIAADAAEPGDETPVEADFLAPVRQYDYPAYWRFMRNAPSYAAQAKWFNENYAGRPIVMNPAEGAFDGEGESMAWREVTTNDRPIGAAVEGLDWLGPQVKCAADGTPTMEPEAVKFSDPGYKRDGIWVEQCLGAKVRAKVELIFEDALGHRWKETVDATEADPQDAFRPSN